MRARPKLTPDAARAAGDVLERRAESLKSMALAQLLRDAAAFLLAAALAGRGYGAEAPVIAFTIEAQRDLFDGGAAK